MSGEQNYTGNHLAMGRGSPTTWHILVLGVLTSVVSLLPPTLFHFA